jgi:hypothetical protein
LDLFAVAAGAVSELIFVLQLQQALPTRSARRIFILCGTVALTKLERKIPPVNALSGSKHHLPVFPDDQQPAVAKGHGAQPIPKQRRQLVLGRASCCQI